MFGKDSMKMKEIGPEGACATGASLDPPLENMGNAPPVIFFHFHAVSLQKLCQIIGWCPSELAPSGKYWIRHWLPKKCNLHEIE